MLKLVSKDKKLQAYVIGLALGDGNLSNSNGRAVRLRVTCDKKYPKLIEHIKSSISKLFPSNKVSLVKKKDRSLDVSCYSNKWEKILGWKAREGSKFMQQVSIPKWILVNKFYIKECLRGLFQTDGSIFKDRNYTHVNMVSCIPNLAQSTYSAIRMLGYKPNMQIFRSKTEDKYTIRVSKDVNKFIKDIKLWKA